MLISMQTKALLLALRERCLWGMSATLEWIVTMTPLCTPTTILSASPLNFSSYMLTDRMSAKMDPPRQR